MPSRKTRRSGISRKSMSDAPPPTRIIEFVTNRKRTFEETAYALTGYGVTHLLHEIFFNEDGKYDQILVDRVETVQCLVEDESTKSVAEASG